MTHVLDTGLLATVIPTDAPFLVAPESEALVTACAKGLLSHKHAEDMLTAPITADDGSFWPQPGSWEARYRPYVVKAGVLYIPVKGLLLHNFSYSVGGYATGYAYIQKALERGLADPEVKGIALVVESPGGHVAGCFDLVERIYKARSVKPIAAFAHEHAYSAAYAIYSAARPGMCWVSKTGGVGSIGVVTMHVDYSKRLENDGVKITFVYAGKHKIDGNQYQPLSKDAKARIQSRIDASYEVFVQGVAQNRKMEEQAVRDTEALTFTATEAVDQGLADKIGPLDDALAEFATICLHGDEGEDTMTQTTTPAADSVSKADHEAAVAAARTQATTDATAAERKRITDIMGCDEAKDRPVAAKQVAMTTGMDLAAAKTFLAGLPKEAAPAATTETTQTNAGSKVFEQVMNGQEQGPGAGSGQEDNRNDEAKAADSILANVLGPKPAAK